MLDSKVVSHEEWLKARLELLAAEKDILGKGGLAVRHPWPVAGLPNR